MAIEICVVEDLGGGALSPLPGAWDKTLVSCLLGLDPPFYSQAEPTLIRTLGAKGSRASIRLMTKKVKRRRHDQKNDNFSS